MALWAWALVAVQVMHVMQVTALPSSRCPRNDGKQWCLQIDGDDTIILDGSVFKEVKTNLEKIRDLLNTLDTPDSKKFDQFFMFNNQEVRRLEANTFADLKFTKIKIKNCTKLIRIDPNAFNGTQELITKVHVDLISITGPKNIDDFFEALNNMKNLEELTLLNHNIITIPSFAFRQHSLQTLELDGPLDTINNNAFFHLDGLKILRLYKSVKHIPKHSFDFKTARNKTLDIYFDITFNTIESGIFSHVLRPINLNLYLKKLKDFSQKVFEPILMSEMRHDIVFHGDIKDMPDKCILVWLFREKQRFLGGFSFKVTPSMGGDQLQDNCESNSIDSINDSQVNSSGVNLNLPINSMPISKLIDKYLIILVGSLLTLNLI